MPRKKKKAIEYVSFELPADLPVILSGGQCHVSDEKSGKLCFHDHMEIGICRSGSGLVEFDGGTVEFGAGDVTVISRNIPHMICPEKGTASEWTHIYAEPDGILSGSPGEIFPDTGIFKDMIRDIHCILHPADLPDIVFLANEIGKELEERQEGFRESVRGLFLTLFIKLMRVYRSSHAGEGIRVPEKPGRDDRLSISPALDYIRTHYADDFPIEKLSDLCHMSPTHFRRLFQEIMHTSPLNHLNTTRVMASCELLRSGEGSVLSISKQVGFGSVSSYNRRFQEVTGTSPSEWRKQFCNGADTSLRNLGN